MGVREARCGNVVVETEKEFYLGRFDGLLGDKIILKEAAKHPFDRCVGRDETILGMIRCHLPPEHRYLAVAKADVRRIRHADELD